jgi:predicted dehydrogenase
MKVGVVGYGSIGSRHAANLQVLGHEVMVYDPVTRKDVRFERMIYEQCDAVVVATPTMFHAQAIRACAERGKHMLIEKPMAKIDIGLRELLDLAASKSAAVMMGNNLRFHPCIQQAKQWIYEGEIGTPIWAHFTCAQLGQKYADDGVILNTGAHEVDVALHLFGPARVECASVDGLEFNRDTIADFLLIHDVGVRSSFHLDTVTPNEIREAWIVGDNEKIGLELRNRNASLGANARAYSGNYDGDYFAEIEAFIHRIEGRDTPGATGEDGLATLKLLLDVRRKAGLA